MSDLAQGPGWWIASDGKWYPPEQHPSARARSVPVVTVPTYSSRNEPTYVRTRNHVQDEFVSGGAPVAGGQATALAIEEQVVTSTELPSFWAGPEAVAQKATAPNVPAPPPPIIPQVHAPRPNLAAPDAVPLVGVDLVNGPATARPPAQGAAAPAGGYGGQSQPLSPYAEGVYSGAALNRRRARRHLPIWWVLIAVAVAAAATAGTLYYLRDTNPHRSAVAVAEDYVAALSSGDKHRMQADVLPGDQPAAIGVEQAELSFAVTGVLATGDDQDVGLLVCTNLYAGSSCSKEIDGALAGAIPTRKVHGAWYVDAASLPACQADVQQLACLAAP